MQKDFTNWHKIKEIIHNRKRAKLFNEREIWWCSLGLNIGDEQDGKNNFFERPVLILKKFNKNIFWGIPLTSQEKNNKYYCQIVYKNREDFLILSQIKLISGKRLLRKVARLPSNSFEKIKEKLKSLL